MDPRKIATAFSVDRNGNVRKHFKSMNHWAYHVGGKLLSYEIEKRSIGIELENWGILKQTQNGFLNYKFEKVECPVVELSAPWRNAEFTDGSKKEIVAGKYFEAYTPVQIKSTIELVGWILDNVPGIPHDMPINFFDLNKFANQYTGVVGHGSLVSYKTDIHPGFPIDQLAGDLHLNSVD